MKREISNTLHMQGMASGGGGSSGDGGEAVLGSSGDEKGGSGGGAAGGDSFEGDRSSAGNRWPRQETLALLKIRSDMDAAFRDSSLKGPLWEEISRKMTELGYQRSGKKCKEKFENVYKYHKRTKDGRVTKADGKNYRFFDQLRAFDHHQHQQQHSGYSSLPPPPPPSSQRQVHSEEGEEAVPVTMVMPAGTIHHHVTVTSSGTATTTTGTAPAPHPISIIHHQQMNSNNNNNNNNNNPIMSSSNQMPQLPAVAASAPQPAMRVEQLPMRSPSWRSASATQSSSSSMSSDEEVVVTGSRKKKRKWKDFFERMTKEVISKQEELQRRFMEAVEKRERDRTTREEAWKEQELARLKREHENLIQDRSMAAAKDAALISFLQKISEQRNIPLPLSLQAHIQQPQPQQPPPPLPPPVQVQKPPPQQPPQQPQPQATPPPKTNGGNHEDVFQSGGRGGGSLSRWPKAEVEALINLRTNMDSKYQENTPKGPLWEEISGAMKKLGYNRNAKRCKEKWENINKYFKKVKESSKKRREDSKTCPYFHQLDALYRQKNNGPPQVEIKPAAEVPVGPIPAHESEDREDSDDYEDEEEEEEANGYEFVANNNNNSSDNNGGDVIAGAISTTTITSTTTATATATAK